ncbi:pilus assembly protein Flp/PilA [Hoeflea marina]|uniref:Pilus assembly protein Flp/PilA n=1 Tax=Hoeflea marina TaxID=274592 RepID=A0A317PE67_9HYPH|nr:pilus assembly protein Flp/PilA [Hoeflea marina]
MSQTYERRPEPAPCTAGLERLARRFAADRSGATAIEYALISTLIAVSLIYGAQMLGNSINQLFANTSTDLTNSL